MFAIATLASLFTLASMAVADTMLAAVYTPGNNSLVMNPNFPVPTAEEGEVVLKVAACGVCHTDVFFISAARPDPRTYVMGHEIIGTPVQIGPGVLSNISTSQLYGVHLFDPTSTDPVNEQNGLGRDGGYAEFVVVNQFQLIPVPDGLAPEVATVATDSLTTVFNAVNNNAQVKQGDRVLIYGAGGLGHQAVQLAKHLGATVFVVDIRPEARQLALSLGAEQAFDPIDFTDVVGNGTFSVDTVIDFVASAQSFALSQGAVAFKVTGTGVDWARVARHGRIVVVGISAETLTFDSGDLILSDIDVSSSIYGSPDDMRSAFDLLAQVGGDQYYLQSPPDKRVRFQGIVKPVVTVAALEDVNSVLSSLTAHQITGRTVVVPGLNSNTRR
ncbi:GroES-like protein [Lenzites betulinus]|nr:GroES-like protein [Lenzites betulinus]